uniref:Erythrocyte membrane protein 1 (PfEMP1) n=1 Tax=Plasmodium falciparum (isolate 3D7) TaxID=36329 RepID=UPI0009AAEB88|nr:Chain A, Erythrocyte membrane protein 1 (PfEMP1) [Plasmodium falciparum 3D7]
SNPCAKPHGKKLATVKQIAQYYKRKAYIQLNERGSRSALKGDASQGQYDRGGKADDFKTKLCEINEKHSNARSNSLNPCNGKDNNKVRFNVGTPWQSGEKIATATDVYLPPRRQHFCTSNLEYLINGGHQAILNVKNGKINHSFLGDVLLAAKYQAQHTMKDYKSKNDKEGICRAIRYSFADIGDIIKGTDLWDKDGGEIKTQNHLVTIFDKIKAQLPKDIKGKYTGTKHLELRKDWWEANRDQVWKAMQCGNDNPCSGESDHTPLHDYIPQRLRWMTEWAEWYCKEQSRLYDKLKVCEECMRKGESCTKGSGECATCKEACEEYNKEIKKWEQQWDAISYKYLMLYAKARITAINGGPGYYNTEVQEEDKPVVDFLYNLYLQNGGKKGPPPDTHRVKALIARVKRDAARNRVKRADGSSATRVTATTTITPYSTAAGYIHQEAHIGDCQKQTQFCKNKNGSDVSDTEADPTYAFRDKPHDHDTACKC